MKKLFLTFIFISGYTSINLNRNSNAIDMPFELEINNPNHEGWETFDNLIDEKYIVGLSEATHHTDGFNRARGQFIKRLVDSKDFRLYENLSGYKRYSIKVNDQPIQKKPVL